MYLDREASKYNVKKHVIESALQMYNKQRIDKWMFSVTMF
mgnify:CR=1 FL=1